MNLSRRQLLAASTVAGASLAVPGVAATATPNLVRRTGPPCRPGSCRGDVTPNSAVVWSRTDRRARLVVDLTSHGRFDRAIRLRGPVTGARRRLHRAAAAEGLRPGQRYDYRIGFEDSDGRLGESARGFVQYAGPQPRPCRFVWTGDTAGQGYGINPELGGMVAYQAMHETRPDFFLHSGDNIYADGPIAAEVKVADGTIWKNVVTEEVSKVAETLAEYRGRYKYNLLDDNVRGAVRRRADHQPVGRPRDGQQLVPGRDPGPTTATPRSGSTCSRPGPARRSSSTCRWSTRRAGTGSTAR